MASPSIDLTNPTEVVKEIFDDDRWIKDEFSTHLSSEILRFGETLAESFKRFPQLDKLSSDSNEQAAFVAGYVFGVFDDLLVSMKLLVSGKMIASGNLMRQALEGVAVSILCASSELVAVRKQKQIVKINYWERLKSDDPLVNAHLSVQQLEINCDALGVSRDAIKTFKSARQRYHLFSHPSFMSLASRIALGEAGPIYIGGNFDAAKLPAYRVEISERTSLCGLLPKIIDGLIVRLTK